MKNIKITYLVIGLVVGIIGTLYITYTFQSRKVVVTPARSEAAGGRSGGARADSEPPIVIDPIRETITIKATDFTNWFFGTFGGGKSHPPLEN